VSSVYAPLQTVPGGHTIPIPYEPTGPEQELVRRAQHGDVGAFEALYRAHVNRVYAVTLRLTGDPDLAQDLTQEAFVRAWRKLGSFRGESAFSTWLHPLAVNVALSERRSRRRREARVTTTDDLGGLERDATPAAGGHALDLERALGQLPEGAREVFVLHDVYGYTHEEIGGQLGIAAGTSKAQLHRARQLLREALGR